MYKMKIDEILREREGERERGEGGETKREHHMQRENIICILIILSV